MKIQEVPYSQIRWDMIPPKSYPGITGEAIWRTYEMGNIRVRMVEYTPGYFADHWCSKGHVILLLEGELSTELSDGRIIHSKAGETVVVGDDTNPHRSSTQTGAKLYIVD